MPSAARLISSASRVASWTMALTAGSGGAVWLVVGAVCAVAALVFVLIVVMATMAGADTGSPLVEGGGGGSVPSELALADIPAPYLDLYTAAGAEYGIDWAVLAGIGSVETRHGQLKAEGVTSGANAFGCCGGPMQFYFRPYAGRLEADETNGSTWGRMGVDGNGDGIKDVWDPADAIPAAARYLKASGAPGDYKRAIFAYNHADWYVADVLARAERYRAVGVIEPGRFGPDDSTATGNPRGEVVIPEAVNRPGIPIDRRTLAFLEEVAGVYGGTMIVSSGSGGKHGARSDHYGGHAADFGMATNGSYSGSPVGDRMMRACLVAAGSPEDEATQIGRRGGLVTKVHRGLRVQCIWKVEGHFSHVHIGARPTG